MYSRLAGFCMKHRVLITTVWLLAAVALFIFAPTISSVGVTDESQFLPQDTQSAAADRLVKEKFAAASEKPAKSTGLIVFYNEKGLSEADRQEASTIRDWLNSADAPDVVQKVTSVFDAAALESSLISTDGTTMLMSLDFSEPPLSDEAKEGVTQIRAYLEQNSHPGVLVYLTGEAGFFHDLFDSIMQTIDRTTLVTVLLVAVLLLIIYRSPVAMMVPLVAIGASFAVARGILGFMGQAGVPISTLADAYLVVIVFGIGTDYCLFIVSRFREELRERHQDEARLFTMKHIGPVITASALTVIVAFLALGISRFGMTKTTGYAMAIGVAITLLAGLTLVPALMSMLGRHLFWPTRTKGTEKAKRFTWGKIGDWVSKHPLVVSLPIIIILLIPYIALPNLKRSADIINQMPKSAESVQGYQVLTDHFPVGELSPLYMLIESPGGDMTTPGSLQSVKAVVSSLAGVAGVSRVGYYATPADELGGMAGQVRGIAAGVATGSGLDKLASLSALGENLQAIAIGYPGIVQSPNFQQVTAVLAQFSKLTGQLQTANPQSMAPLLAQLQQALNTLSTGLDGLNDEFNLKTSTPFTAYLLSTYFSTDKSITRVNIVLSGQALTTEATNTVVRIRDMAKESIAASTINGSAYYVGGQTALRADIILTNDADFGKVTALAIAGILLVIIILLRSLLAPLLMVLTVLLNYGATLGIATWIFIDLLDQGAMIYMLPIFIFVILVALGADYNIFLVSRIREESQNLTVKEAVSRAVSNTGGVITACGIILAGTFATLTTAPLQVVLQIGAAIAIGVIVDTFVVRALLVPALISLVGRWSWWPSRFFRMQK
jgi:putative drug exporter of the RND superfamily